MENKNQTLLSKAWPWTGLILILLAIGPRILGIQLQSSAQWFLWGMLTGLVMVYLAAFIYKTGKKWSGKQL